MKVASIPRSGVRMDEVEVTRTLCRITCRMPGSTARFLMARSEAVIGRYGLDVYLFASEAASGSAETVRRNHERILNDGTLRGRRPIDFDLMLEPAQWREILLASQRLDVRIGALINAALWKRMFTLRQVDRRSLLQPGRSS